MPRIRQWLSTARWGVLLGALALGGCRRPSAPATDGAPRLSARPAAPAPVPAPPEEFDYGRLARRAFRAASAPAGLSAAKVLLGRRLFHEPALSADGTVSCASCHPLDRGGADGRRRSPGVRGALGAVNTPTVLNVGTHVAWFWDGRAASLEEQVSGPVTNPVEMASTWPRVVAALRRSESYRAAFAEAYPDGVTAANARDAIATFERTLVTPSRLDQYLLGDEGALAPDELAGLRVFLRAGCQECHNGVGVGGGSFQRMSRHGDYFAARGDASPADLGRYNVTRRDEDRRVFRVPTLRNVARTAPYFHDGHPATLDDAVRLMARHQVGREFTDAEVRAVVCFLRSLDEGVAPSAAACATPSPAR
ncbi:MAG: c-type cytochrome [Deltaproteobacteria bacterium]|nr:c-type cytochrome [Deltaproteobacteria bacterium]